MRTETTVDGFRIGYDRAGHGCPVVALHGWPGDRTDYDRVIPALSTELDVIAPDLCGVGESDMIRPDDVAQYGAAAQARSVLGLIEELRLDRPVLVGYDIGSRIAQEIVARRPGLVSALVLTPPVPGIGRRSLSVEAQREFWYQPFHQLSLAEQLLDGNPRALRLYLAHFWHHWSGPQFTMEPDRLDHLVEVYGPPGSFAASIAWYRASAGTVALSVAEEDSHPQWPGSARRRPCCGPSTMCCSRRAGPIA